jgi:threonine-phosphate decarboxylase
MDGPMEKRTVKKVIHGGKRKQMEEKSGTRFLDFSASLNPFPPFVNWDCSAVDWETYPDDEYTVLKEAIGRVFHRPVEEITIGNGSIEVIRTFCRAVLSPGDWIVLSEPTFGEYLYSARLAGADQTASVTEARAQFLCNPNNPTGTLLPRSDVVMTANEAADAGRYLFLDEAFVELSDPDQSLVNYPTETLVVARSLTKCFAVPGLRMGFGFGPPDLIETMEATRLPWTVSAVAEVFALHALQEYGALAESRYAIQQERRFIEESLDQIGISYLPSSTNFLLVHLGVSAHRVCTALLRQGILVRDCTSFGLPASIRIAVRTRQENTSLIEALETCLP